MKHHHITETVSKTHAGGYHERADDPASLLERPVAETRRWYAVLALPRQEERALLNLERQGFQAFVPRRFETKRVRQRFVTRLTPVFSRYLMVALDLDRDPWHVINSTYGVSRIVSFGQRPQPLPTGVAETLRDSLDDKGVLQFEELLAPGDSVRLLRGPFAEQLGVLQSLDDKGRVKLLLEILGGKVLITTARADLEKAE